LINVNFILSRPASAGHVEGRFGRADRETPEGTAAASFDKLRMKLRHAQNEVASRFAEAMTSCTTSA